MPCILHPKSESIPFMLSNISSITGVVAFASPRVELACSLIESGDSRLSFMRAKLSLIEFVLTLVSFTPWGPEPITTSIESTAATPEPVPSRVGARNGYSETL